MATRVEKILANARRTLADPAKQRWSDDDLLAILSEGQEDFNQQTEFLHERVHVPIVQGNPYFKLPDDCWKITRVLYDGSILPLVTHQELDEISYPNVLKDFGSFRSGDWESDTGTPEAIIYDRRDFTLGKVYPVPDNIPSEEQLLTPYGVVATIDSLYGVITSEEENGNITAPIPLYGVTTSYEEFTKNLLVYYLSTPEDITALDSPIETPQMYDIALKYYVCGHAFLNDIDTGYQNKGVQQLKLYDRYVKNAKKTSMTDYIRAGAFETTYRRII